MLVFLSFQSQSLKVGNITYTCAEESGVYNLSYVGRPNVF